MTFVKLCASILAASLALTLAAVGIGMGLAYMVTP